MDCGSFAFHSTTYTAFVTGSTLWWVTLRLYTRHAPSTFHRCQRTVHHHLPPTRHTYTLPPYYSFFHTLPCPPHACGHTVVNVGSTRTLTHPGLPPHPHPHLPSRIPAMAPPHWWWHALPATSLTTLPFPTHCNTGCWLCCLPCWFPCPHYHVGWKEPTPLPPVYTD